MRATAGEIRVLATNMTMIATDWLSFEYARQPRAWQDGEAFGRGAYQVMAMVAPFLVGDARLLLERLSNEYVID